jgi:hypothetical protein
VTICNNTKRARLPQLVGEELDSEEAVAAFLALDAAAEGEVGFSAFCGWCEGKYLIIQPLIQPSIQPRTK